MLKVLAGAGASLGQVDLQGDSAVYWAARQGHAEVIQWLVEQGVHINQQNKVTSQPTHPPLHCKHTLIHLLHILF